MSTEHLPHTPDAGYRTLASGNRVFVAPRFGGWTVALWREADGQVILMGDTGLDLEDLDPAEAGDPEGGPGDYNHIDVQFDHAA